uniref:Uncharacterized protein n=1 Tax=Fagus sylvatica TaxID=28930 RepID=A0A2N9IGU2_FAGSY
MEVAKVEWINNERSRRMMEEQAKEELEILETQHPNRFKYLKLELESFIFLLQSQTTQLLLPENSTSTSTFPTSSTATTQESTSNKKRKVSDCVCVLMEDGKEASKQKFQMGTDIMGYMKGDIRKTKKRDRVDELLDRAQACLQKIQHLKASLLFCS